MKYLTLPRVTHFLVFGSLLFSIVFPATCLLAVVLLLLLATLQTFRDGGVQREIPPGVLSIFLLLLTALGYGQVFSAGPGIDSEAILLTLSACLLFVPFYLPPQMIDPMILLPAGLVLLFGEAFVLLGGLITPDSLPDLSATSLAAGPLPARLVLFIALTMPLVAVIRSKLPAMVLSAAWLALTGLAVAVGDPLLMSALLLGILVAALSLRTLRGFLLLILAMIVMITAVSIVQPGVGLNAKFSGWLAEDRQFRDYIGNVFNGVTRDLYPEEAGIGLANLRQRLSRFAPDGRLEMTTLRRFPPPLLFPYAFGILFALLFFLLLLAVLRRLVRTLKMIPRDSAERPMAAGLLAGGATFCTLALVSGQALLNGYGTPFFVLFGCAMLRSARPVEPLLRSQRKTDNPEESTI